MALKVGIQMYSVRNEMAKDPVNTIGKVAKMGYKYIELANLDAKKDFGCGFGAKASSLKKIAEDFGSTIISAHVNPLDDENIDKVLEYHHELGTKYIMSKPFDVYKEDCLKAVDLYNRLGEKCRAAGIQHCLHTGLAHFCDDGANQIDFYFEHVEPKNLMFELDFYWMMRSGFDPIESIKKYANRIIMVHQKDLPKDFNGVLNINTIIKPGEALGLDNFFNYCKKEDFCEVGTGQMNLQAYIDATLKYTKAEYILLEQDFTSMLNELDSVRLSMEGFKKLSGLEW
jgi:sugar phosphate isomerase/epimerase